MSNWFFIIIGSLVWLLGAILFITPLPLIPSLLMATGLTCIIHASPTARRCVIFFRARYQWIHRAFCFLETHIGKRVKLIEDILKQTRP